MISELLFLYELGNKNNDFRCFNEERSINYAVLFNSIVKYYKSLKCLRKSKSSFSSEIICK
jgi:hypothetical protein